jgi:hypothetical protein
MHLVITSLREKISVLLLISIFAGFLHLIDAQKIIDRELAAAAATVPLGGQLTAGVAIAFTTAADMVPGTLNTATITFGFKIVTQVSNRRQSHHCFASQVLQRR